MSAAVVPGAKLDAMTGNGPAFPFMLRPRDDDWGFGDEVRTLAWSEVMAEAMRLERLRMSALEEGRDGGLGRCEDTLVLEEER